MPLFKALSMDVVTLEVLDLTDVPFAYCQDIEDQLLGGLCTTFESNSATLRALALPDFPSSDITEKAVEMSTLKKLHVLTISPRPDREVWRSASPFTRMMRAIDRHADRTRKLSALSELRLFNARYFPSKRDVMHSDDSACVFHMIKTLRVATCTFGYESLQNCGLFLSLLRNLEGLFWDDVPGLKQGGFDKLCLPVSELHFCIDWITSVLVGDREHQRRQNSISVNRFFPAADAAIRTKNPTSRGTRAIVMGHATRRKVRELTRYCPNLEYLSQFLTFKNVTSLTKLLSKCGQLKALELIICTENIYSDFRNSRGLAEVTQICCRAERWRSLSRVIPESHKNLCQLAVNMMPVKQAMPVGCVKAVVDCFEKVVRAIGARAINISFRVKLQPRKNAFVLEQLCRILGSSYNVHQRLSHLSLTSR